MEKRVRIKLN